MQKVQILDCTLRDGGYCNKWEFGNANIITIIEGLRQAKIDVIECGFLTTKVDYCEDNSRFTSLEQIAEILPYKDGKTLYVCMMNFGEYDPLELPEYDGKSVDGIRVAFHKKDAYEAIRVCEAIKSKGYKVFLQPMVSLNYSEEEFVKLIRRCNELSPYAFYIVDSFGFMKRKELLHLFSVVEHNLNKNIAVGFHSHNNMQLAYANAQALVDMKTDRNLIIDSSVFGMGRGAGNLNTELFIEYLNDNIGTDYNIKPLLHIIDDVLSSFYEKNYWGYSLPNYLSAKHNTHPNYAGYLEEKHTLTVDDMDEIFSCFQNEKKVEYDSAYIERLYKEYLCKDKKANANSNAFKEILQGKRILLIAPGRSVEMEQEKIIAFCESKNVLSIGVNFEYAHYMTDYVFVSNLRRYRQMKKYDATRTIVTSNIPIEESYITVDYKMLLNEDEVVSDNSGLMLIKYLIMMGVKDIYLAGMDGYSHEVSSNFAQKQMEFVLNKDKYDIVNRKIESVLNKYAKDVNISFLTTPKYIKLI